MRDGCIVQQRKALRAKLGLAAVDSAFVTADSGDDRGELTLRLQTRAYARIGKAGTQSVAQTGRARPLADFVGRPRSSARENSPRFIGDRGDRRALTAVDPRKQEAHPSAAVSSRA